MPSKPPRPCRAHLCPQTTSSTSGYCSEHEHLSSGWNKPGRLSASARGYGANWRRIRSRILKRDNHLCQECMRQKRIVPAYAVDHITPKARGGTDSFDNLEAICKPCHQAKTNREALGRC